MPLRPMQTSEAISAIFCCWRSAFPSDSEVIGAISSRCCSVLLIDLLGERSHDRSRGDWGHFVQRIVHIVWGTHAGRRLSRRVCRAPKR